MYFARCSFNEENDYEDFIIYSEHEIRDDMGFKVKETNLTKDSYPLLPILHQEQILARVFRPHLRTPDKKLSEMRLDTWADIYAQHQLIQNKISRLSKSEREIVEAKYNFIISSDPVVKQDTEEEPNV